MIRQVQAVLNAVNEVLGDLFTEKETNVNEIITPEQRTEVREIVLNGVLNGEIDYKGSLDDEAAVRRYVNGMVDNHFRKSRLLNGGSPYKPSRTGSKRDPQLKELSKLLKTLPEGSEDFNKVQAHIEKRTTELSQERSAKNIANTRANIDTSVLPPNLANMVGQ